MLTHTVRNGALESGCGARWWCVERVGLVVVQGVRSLVTSSVPVRGGGAGAPTGTPWLLAGGGHDVGRDGQRLLELLGEIAGARCARTFIFYTNAFFRWFPFCFHAHTDSPGYHSWRK